MTQIVTLAGTTGRDAQYKTTQRGDGLCSFSVAVNTGYGENKQTTWWDVTRWGKGADKLAELLPKGSKVTVVGELSTREHDGKTYLQCRADHVTLQGGRTDGKTSGAQREAVYERSGGGGVNHADDLDGDDVPFMRCDPIDNIKRRVI